MMKSIALAVLLVVLLGFVGVQYYITSVPGLEAPVTVGEVRQVESEKSLVVILVDSEGHRFTVGLRGDTAKPEEAALFYIRKDRKSTRLNSSHVCSSYAVFCLKKH